MDFELCYLDQLFLPVFQFDQVSKEEIEQWKAETIQEVRKQWMPDIGTEN